MAAQGINLLLVSENSQQLEAARASLQQHSTVQIDTITCDLAEEHSAEHLLEALNDRLPSISMLINNAGFFVFGAAAEIPAEQARRMINLHVQTTTRLAMYFGQQFKTEGRGFILNVSSISALKFFPGIAHYASTKAYLRAFSRSLHLELKPHGVHVTCLIPGATDTTLYDSSTVNMALGRRLGIVLPPSVVAAKGLDALYKNRPEIIPGIVTKLSTWLMRLIPYAIVYQIRLRTNYLNEKERPKPLFHKF